MGWEAPRYAHLPVIMKLDEQGHKRKLSKRLDSEAAVSYFLEDGYPQEALIMYLMTIANSNFEEWIFNQRFEHMEDFVFSFDRMSLDGALFDIGKMNFFSREILGKMNKEEITERALEYAKKYNPTLLDLIEQDRLYFASIMNIEREKDNPRKDYEKFGNVADIIGFFYKENYEQILKNPLPFNEKFSKQTIIETLEDLRDHLSLDNDEQGWFANMKEIGGKQGFALNNKEYKANPEAFKGSIGDVAELLRITLSGRKNSPNLYYVMQILGKEECDRRINSVISTLR